MLYQGTSGKEEGPRISPGPLGTDQLKVNDTDRVLYQRCLIPTVLVFIGVRLWAIVTCELCKLRALPIVIAHELCKLRALPTSTNKENHSKREHAIKTGLSFVPNSDIVFEYPSFAKPRPCHLLQLSNQLARQSTSSRNAGGNETHSGTTQHSEDQESVH